MRLDKFLKLTRLIKRRSVAKEIIEEGLIKINGRVAKPANEIKIDDIIELKLGTHILTIKVKDVRDITTKETANKLYEIINDLVILPK